MTYLKDVILELYPQDINFFNNTLIINQNPQETTVLTNPKHSKSYIFRHETRCITAFYSRLLSKFKTNKVWRIIIECVEDSVCTEIRELDGVVQVQVRLDYVKYFSSNNEEKKRIALDTLQEGICMVAHKYGWDKTVFKEVYQEMVNLDYKNIYVYKQKVSPNRIYVSRIVCEHEVSYFDIYVEIREKMEIS
ncbi:hypothetical protein [Bacillus pacificus]|uniref:hypothetical protein n=1 Tax=Bacillus pacificus TaxID=2026187 RepID=UPI003D646739